MIAAPTENATRSKRRLHNRYIGVAGIHDGSERGSTDYREGGTKVSGEKVMKIHGTCREATN